MTIRLSVPLPYNYDCEGTAIVQIENGVPVLIDKDRVNEKLDRIAKLTGLKFRRARRTLSASLYELNIDKRGRVLIPQKILRQK